MAVIFVSWMEMKAGGVFELLVIFGRQGRAVLMDDTFHVMACVLWLWAGWG